MRPAPYSTDQVGTPVVEVVDVRVCLMLTYRVGTPVVEVVRVFSEVARVGTPVAEVAQQ